MSTAPKLDATEGVAFGARGAELRRVHELRLREGVEDDIHVVAADADQQVTRPRTAVECRQAKGPAGRRDMAKTLRQAKKQEGREAGEAGT